MQDTTAILQWSLCYTQDGRTYLEGPFVREDAIRLIKEQKLKGITPEPYVPKDWLTQRYRELGEKNIIIEEWSYYPNTFPDWVIPRINSEDPLVIDVYMSQRDAKLRKRTSLNIGRFLTLFYSNYYNAAQITVLTTQWKTKYAIVNDLLWATTEEEIIHVMRNSSFWSCANWTDWPYDFTHPAAIFASGDWALAYRKNAEGKIISRAYCVPERKLIAYIRGEYYGMEAALKREGFHFGDKEEFIGVRFKRVLDPDGYVMSPHIDSHFPVVEDEQGLIIIDKNGDIELYGYDYKAIHTTAPYGRPYRSKYWNTSTNTLEVPTNATQNS